MIIIMIIIISSTVIVIMIIITLSIDRVTGVVRRRQGVCSKLVLINTILRSEAVGGCLQGTAGGEVIQFGASRDQQTAADTQKLSGYVATGAATFCFIQVPAHA
jgi:hypothetical protein